MHWIIVLFALALTGCENATSSQSEAARKPFPDLAQMPVCPNLKSSRTPHKEQLIKEMEQDYASTEISTKQSR